MEGIVLIRTADKVCNATLPATEPNGPKSDEFDIGRETNRT